jgi:hypothetical protein
MNLRILRNYIEEAIEIQQWKVPSELIQGLRTASVKEKWLSQEIIEN